MHIKNTLTPLAAAAILLAAQGVLAQDQLVKFGVSGPLSGSNAFAGKDDENGVRLAVEELNAQKIKVAGKPVRFELLSEDDQGDPKTGVAVAQKFVDQGVKFVFGPYNSGVAIPASKVYNDAGIVMSTDGTNPKVTQSGYKGVFRIVASDNQVGASMASYAAKVLKLKTVGVIDDSTAFGQGLAQEFVKEARRNGLTVAASEHTTDHSSDFSAILTKLKSKKVDAIFFGGYAPQGAPMARQMRTLGMNVKLMGGDTLCSPEMPKLGGDAVGDNVLCARGGTVLDKLASGPAFRAKYEKRFKQKPDVYAAPYYDQVMFVVQTMKAVNSLDPLAVAAGMHVQSYKGISGDFSFDEAGNMKQSAVTVYTYKNGELQPVSQ